MRLLFISNSGEGLPVAYRMMKEGNDVGFYIHNKYYQKNYDGIIEKVKLKGLRQAAGKSDYVIFDMTRTNEKKDMDIAMLNAFGLKSNLPSVFGPVANKIAETKPVIGASQWTEAIEFDRYLGTEIAKKIGLKIPKTKFFKSEKQAQEFLKGNNSLWVLKPDNNDDLDLTYVEKYPGELHSKFNGDYKGRIKGSLILQEKVDGTELSSEAWWNGFEWTAFNHTIEQKRLMNADLGPSIGSQSNCVWVNHESFMKPYFEALTPYIKKSGYIGAVDMNCIVQGDTPYFLEFTARMGFDALYCLLTLLSGSITDFFTGGFRGDFKDGFACSQRVTIPPFPNCTDELLDKMAKDVPLDFDLDEFWAEDVYLDKSLKCAGADGIIGVMAKYGNSIGGAYGNVYRALRDIKIGSYMQYRTDPVKPAEKRYNAVKGIK